MEQHVFSPIVAGSSRCRLCDYSRYSLAHKIVTDRTQVGGDHYRTPDGVPEHWDLAVALGWDFFQYQITKYIWRWKDKGGVQDLRKAADFLRKYIHVLDNNPQLPAKFSFPNDKELGAEPEPHGYVDQDSPPTGPGIPTTADASPVESGRGKPISSMPVSLLINGVLYVQAMVRNKE